MLVVVEIKIVDEDTGALKETIVKTYEGSYGYEVARFFRDVGEKIAHAVDPSFDID